MRGVVLLARDGRQVVALGGLTLGWVGYQKANVRPNLSIDQNLRRQFLERDALLKDEPRLLLQDFVSVTHNCAAILRAIAEGHRTPKEIASQAGLPFMPDQVGSVRTRQAQIAVVGINATAPTGGLQACVF
ncbi:MAG: hypothetical protein KA764_16390 [Anaerolineales bacterium]|nr:hypothetical protein [Anaerolineales bacterium]